MAGFCGAGLRGLVFGVVLGVCVLVPGRGVGGVHLPVPHFYQPDDQTCLPTSLMMALNFLGRVDDFSSDTVQGLHMTCQYNRFNVPELVRERYGLYALANWHNLGWTRETVERELDLGRPVVLGVNTGRYGHFVLAVGYTDDGRVIINNPTRPLGNSLGGHDRVVEWDDFIWRGGIIVRPEPFPVGPELSGVAIGRDGLPLESTVDFRLTSGEDRLVSFTLVNNGRVAWPEELFLAPVDPDSSPTVALNRGMGLDWLGEDRVCVALPGLDVGTSGVVEFRVRAPEVEDVSTVLQYFQLVDGDGNWFGESWLAGPGHRNMGVRMIVLPRDREEVVLPLVDGVENGEPVLDWGVKHGELRVVEGDGVVGPPDGSGVVELFSEDLDFDSAWVGDPELADYHVESWVWCEVRPDVKGEGYERVGLFARDNGQRMGVTKNEREIGHCLAFAFDCDDGRLRAGNVVNGGVLDLRDEAFYIEESGWYRLGISCVGERVTYWLDGEVFHVEERGGRLFGEGECGVFYHVVFDEDLGAGERGRGVRFAGFEVRGE